MQQIKSITKLLLLTLAGLLIAQTALAQISYRRTLYWNRVDQALKKMEQPPSEDEGTLRKVYLPYEALRGMKGEHILLAAHEGIYAAQEQMKGKPKAMLERQINYNISRALSGYPYVAPGEAGLTALYDHIRNASNPKEVRTFLLKQFFPNTAVHNSFTRYLQDQAHRDVSTVRELFYRLGREPGEDVDVREAALQSAYNCIYQDYNRYLQEDPTIREEAEKRQRPIVPMDINSEPKIELSLRTQNRLKKSNRDVQNFYGYLDMTLNQADLPERLQQTILNITETAQANLPVKPTVVPTRRASALTTTEPETQPETTTPIAPFEIDLGLPEL